MLHDQVVLNRGLAQKLFFLPVILFVLVVIQTLGTAIFSRFEIETPIWKKLLKWLVVYGGTIGLHFVVGLWALVFPLGLAGLGLVIHLRVCHREGFHPIYATPRRKYYEFRGWKWPE